MKKYLLLALALLILLPCLLFTACTGGEEYYVSIERGYPYGEVYGYENADIKMQVKEGTVLEDPELPLIDGYSFVGWEWYNPFTEQKGWWSFDTPLTAETMAAYGYADSLHLRAVYTRDEFKYVLNADGTGYIAEKLIYMTNKRLEDQGRDVLTITVPDTYRGLPVVAIADGAAEYTYVEEKGRVHGYAEEVVIGKNVKTIGANAFKDRIHDMDAHFTFTVPDSVQEIGESAFESCWFGELILPTGLTRLEYGVFRYCSFGKELVIPETVTSIGAYAFANSHMMSSDKDGYDTYDAVIPDSVTEMGEYAFYDSGLSSIRLSANLTGIAPYTFACCDNLRSITLVDGITALEEGAFSETPLEGITLPDTLTYIGKDCFSFTDLASVSVPESVTYIGEQAFYYASDLETVELPDTLTYIGKWAFESTPFLYALKTEANDYFNPKDAVYYGKYLLLKAGSYVTERTVKDGTVLIASGAFEGDKLMTRITLPGSLKYIGDRAFYECTELTTVSLSDNVLSIGRECFAWCSSLKNVRLSAGLTELPTYAFAGCALGDVVIPESVTKLGSHVFYRGGVTSVRLPSTIQVIPSYAFYACPLGEIELPESINLIMDYAFYESQLQSLTLPSSLPLYIMNSAFEGNFEITELVIPANVTMIDPAAFARCTGLTSLTFGATEGGWRCINYEVSIAQGGVKDLPLSALTDPATAANYLVKDYAGYTWTYYRETAE